MIPKLKIISLFFLLFQVSQLLYAQQEITLDELRTSTAPAFNILEIEPKSVTRPTTPKAFAASILSSVNTDGLKPDLSVEAAPFWWKKKPNITFEQYLQPRDINGFLQTFTFSLATRQRKVSDTLSKGTQFGLGFRGQIFPGRPSKTSLRLIKENLGSESLGVLILATAKHNPAITNRDQLKVQISTTINNIKLKVLPASLPMLSNTEIIDLLTKETFEKELLKEIDTEPIKAAESMDEYIQRIQDYHLKPKSPLELQESLKTRVGWILEVAAASSTAFPSNNFSKDVKFDRLGLWGNLTYRFENMKDEFTLLGRHMESYTDSVSTNNDIGISYSRTLKDFSVSVEGIFRFYKIEFGDKNLSGQQIRVVQRDNTYRLAINGEYKFSESISLTASFGKNFDNVLYTSGNLLALLGLNFGLNSKQPLTLKK